jgi:hypothetical protein
MKRLLFLALLSVALVATAGTVSAQTIPTVGAACVTGNSTFWEQSGVCISSLWQRPAFQFGSASAACASGTAGMVQWTGSALQLCDGASWANVGSGGSSTFGATATNTSPYRSGDVTTGLFSNTATTVQIATAGSEVLRATATQSVGIGTTTPGSVLGVNGGASFGSYSTTAAPSNGLVVSGNVGIGTSSPNTTLDVGGFIEWSGQSRVTSTFSKTSDTTLAAIPGLSATLTAGKTYYFELHLYATSGSNAGATKVDLNGGSATATAIIGSMYYSDNGFSGSTRITALNTSFATSALATAPSIHIYGTITVNTGGTFKPEFAQNASHATASTVAIGSTMLVQQIN